MKFGEYLVQKKVITREQLEKALFIQRSEDLQGYHRMIGYIILNNFQAYDEPSLYELLKEWKISESKKEV